MDLLHDFLPQGNSGVAVIADPGIVLIARPHCRHIVRRVAHEIAGVVIVGGTGLTGNGHAAEVCAGAGAVGHSSLEQLVHEVGGGLLHGLLTLGLVLQNHIAVPVLHPDIGSGRVVDSAVGKSGIGRCHLHGGQAVGEAAQTQRALIHILSHQPQMQVLCGKGIGLRHAYPLQSLDGHGVDGLGHAGSQGGHARIGVGGVFWPRRAVE